jgi:hypothetical protein
MADPVKTPAPPGGYSKEELGYLEALRQPYDTMGRKVDPEEERVDALMKEMLLLIAGPQEIGQRNRDELARKRDEAVAKIEEGEDRMIAVPPEEEPRPDPFKSFLPPSRRKRPVPAPAVVEVLPEDDEDLILSRLP